jgi:hypothetical protein
MKAKSGSYESSQFAKEGLATGELGGVAPTAKDVIKSANARSEKRHAVRSPSDDEADSIFPKSGGETLDKSGVNNNNYITKKGLPYGVTAFYNSLPPGMDIEDQELMDSREQPMRTYSGGLGYPTDGGFGQSKSSIK